MTWPQPTPTPPKASNWRFYAGVATAGAGVVGLVTSAIAFSQVDNHEGDLGFQLYRYGIPSDQRACEAAAAGVEVAGASSPSRVASICDNASEWQTAGVTSAIVGGLFVVGGGALILTSPKVWGRRSGDTAANERRVEIVPVTSPDRAGVLVRGTF